MDRKLAAMIDLEGFLKRRKMKQYELAAELGISKSMVSQLKSGRVEPTHTMCCKLLLAGMTVDELFGRKAWETVLRQVALEKHGELSDEQCRAIVESGLSSLGFCKK